jgi:hypothetical protein
MFIDELFFTCFAFLAPHEFTYIPFPVKALKIILHDLQNGGESAVIPTPGESVQEDDVCLPFPLVPVQASP